MSMAVMERLGLKPSNPLLMGVIGTPTSNATPVPIAEPTKAAAADILEQKAIPMRTKIPDTMLSARNTWPTPLMVPSKKAWAVIDSGAKLTP
eukprot:CAMPEP_0172548140 /NCGR_PEP_ID=MMETSP1067-20121228/17523_1 /TAXON_ID=265564 ORGANISM="Thalassiosira punctigera, Strain Tpunct2005C2" /NCGR_SAMPLE_ID=MMETSP1067 /ASSEMBLY_ACC=CAM_ASM_000444 /LENGTH=91 /DNA_ID=CAMNT_0013335335 /DNA_START=9 /DNA_END=284 /DNA_ORIENTATION=-